MRYSAVERASADASGWLAFRTVAGPSFRFHMAPPMIFVTVLEVFFVLLVFYIRSSCRPLQPTRLLVTPGPGQLPLKRLYRDL